MKNFRRLFRLDTPDAVQQQVDDELQFHLESRADALVRQGWTRDAAHRQAEAEFGDLVAARSQLASIDHARTRRHSRREYWHALAQDVRIALRGFARRPLLAIVVLLTLGLGVGANSAIFSIAEAVLLRSLPYRDVDRLVEIRETRRDNPSDFSEASYPDFLDWRAAPNLFAGVEGYNGTNVTVSSASGAERVRGLRVTAGFFQLLGVSALGRTFVAADDPPGGTAVIVITHEYWQRQFSGARGAIGATLEIDGMPHRVIGVLPPGFRFAPAGDIELYFPLGGSATMRGQRFNHWVNVVGRLRDDVTLAAARSRLVAVMQRLEREYPETNSGRSGAIRPLQEAVIGPIKPTLNVLLGAVAIVLLVACANVASLLLARSMERQGELAVRSALGASRGRLVRQLLTESVLLAIGGGLVGLWMAGRAVPALLSIAPPSIFDQVPHLRDARVNGAVFSYALIIATVVGIAFGLLPALAVTRRSWVEALRSGGRAGMARATQGLRDALVTAQIACVVVLLTGAALMAQSLRHLLDVDPGFDAEGVVTARVALAGPRYVSGIAQQRFFEELQDRVQALPGVQAVGAATNVPLQRGGTNTFRVEGFPEPPVSNRPEATMRGVSRDYFRALGVPVIEGRALSVRDDSAAPRSIVISKSLAHQLFGDRSAIGARMRFYAFPESAWTVVGVVGDVKIASLDAPASPTIYYSHLQTPENRMSLVVRTRRTAATLAALERIVADMDRTLPVYGAETMESRIEHSAAVYARRYPLTLIGSFAGATLVLAIVGLYGLIAYSVVQRTRELALRVALGATNRDVIGLVLTRALKLTGTGLLVGVVVALIVERSLGALLFGVQATDPWTYAAVAAVLGVVSAVASYLPARRATRIDPVVMLRSE